MKPLCDLLKSDFWFEKMVQGIRAKYILDYFKFLGRYNLSFNDQVTFREWLVYEDFSEFEKRRHP